MQPTARVIAIALRLMPDVRQPNHEPADGLRETNAKGRSGNLQKARKRGRTMRWNQESLLKARGVVMVVVAVLILVAYLISRL